MNEPKSKETRSYQDPMAARIKAAGKRREAEAAQYPQAALVYSGFYVKIEKPTKEGGRFFLGAEGIIGTSLSYDALTGFVLDDDGRPLAQMPEPDAKRLTQFSEARWHIEVLVSATFFRSLDKSAAVELAFLCWAPLEEAFDAALTTFSRNISERLANGDRAEVALSQEQFIAVLRSGGAWYLTPATKRAPLEKGTILYKNRRSGTERLTAFALKHKAGCNILAMLFFALMGVGVVLLVRLLFFE